MTTRAVYLELAQSLCTVDFLFTFRRFVILHGKPKIMFSDNGTNFVGAEKEIVSDVKKFTHESFVRSTKLALYRMLRAEQLASNHPTEEILRTLLFEVAGLLNSRPLTYVSSDVKDLQALTPNDLIGRTTTTDIASRPCHDALPSERYRYVQRLTNLFWQMWMKNYLPSLVARKKWHTKERNFQIGDRVIIYDANVPRGQWRIGAIYAVHLGKDGNVRVADVRTETADYRRPIHRLFLIEENSTPV